MSSSQPEGLTNAGTAVEVETSINPQIFTSRVTTLFKALWECEDSANVDVFFLMTGKAEEEESTTRAERIHLWLFGLMFPETLVVFTRTREVLFLTRTKKLAYFRVLGEAVADISDVKFVFVERKSNAAPALEQLLKDQVVSFLRTGVSLSSEFSRVGILGDKSEVPIGAFSTTVRTFLEIETPFVPEKAENQNLKLAFVAVDNRITKVLVVHDAAGIAAEKRAAILSVRLVKELLLARVVTLLETCGKESHQSIAARADQALLSDAERLAKWKTKHGLDPACLDIANSIVQSGSQFDLKASATTSEELLNTSRGAIVVCLTAKYSGYHAVVARTLLLDPSPKEKAAYEKAVEIFQTLVSLIKPGVMFRDVYEKTFAAAEKLSPELAKCMSKSVGHAIGLGFSEQGYNLRQKSEAVIEPGMVIAVSLGFNALVDGERVCAFWLVDTVAVRENEPEFLTNCTKQLADIMYELQSPGEAKKQAKRDSPKKEKAKSKRTDENLKKAQPTTSKSARQSSSPPQSRASSRERESPRRTRMRGRRRDAAMSHVEIEKLMEKQRELRKRKQIELKERFSSGGDFSESKKDVKKLTLVHAYRDAAEFPKDLRARKIYVDFMREAILFPVGKGHTPFSVSTLRTVAHQEEDNGVHSLRISFQVPGAQSLIKSSTDPSPLPDLSEKENALFVKELIYKSSDPNTAQVVKNIREVMKRSKLREQSNEANSENGSAQPALILTRPPAKRLFLRQLMIRPSAGFSKRVVGTLDAHQNGFRYQAPKYEIVDVIYSNIKHAFFQPVVNEMMVILHFVLKSAIMVNKKRIKEVQFYTEAGSQTDDLDNARRNRSIMDPDEMYEEQREREMKKRLNTEFRAFVEQAQAISNVQFEVPFRQLAFTGVTKKSGVTLMPTKDCLVQLVEWPTFVLTLSEVELVSLERIVQGLRGFDMMFVPKDYAKTVTAITTIPTESLPTIKSWLNEIDVVWYEGRNSLNWAVILRTIRDGIADFVERGGFAFFLGDDNDQRSKKKKVPGANDSSSDDDDDSDEEGDEEYEHSSSSDSDQSEKDEDESGDEGSDSDSGSSSGSAASGDEEEDEGLSWDEMERQALAEDRKRGHADSDEEEGERIRKKKKM